MSWYHSIERTETGLSVCFTDGYGRKQLVTLQPAACSCGMSAHPCIHIQWAGELDGAEAQVVVNEQDASAQVAKTHRREDRILKLSRAMDELQLWLDDICSRGLAAQVQENPQFTAAIGTRMADASLGTLQRRLSDLETETLRCIRSNQPVPSAWADLLFVYRAGRNQDQIPQPLWDELTQTLGINLRKDDVKAADQRINDRWTVIALETIQVEPRLKQRNTWLYAQARKSYHAIIEYEFENVSYFSPALRQGFTFEAVAWAYPSVFQSRVMFDAIPETASLTFMPTDFPVFTDLKAVLAHLAKQVKALPWLASTPVMVADLVVRLDTKTKKWLVLDAQGYSLPLLFSQEIEAERLMAQTLVEPMLCFVSASSSGVRILTMR